MESNGTPGRVHVSGDLTRFLQVPPTVDTLHSTLYTLHPTLYTLRSTPFTLNPSPYTLHPIPYTLHPTPYTLHPIPYTLHPTPYTLHPTSYTLHALGRVHVSGDVARVLQVKRDFFIDDLLVRIHFINDRRRAMGV